MIACKGSNVTISCGYLSVTTLPVTWIINGTSFTQQVVDSLLYQLNNHGNTSTLSLRVFSINYFTTFQCKVHSTPNTTTCILGTVTVTTSMCTIYNNDMLYHVAGKFGRESLANLANHL